jgi:hypothetical protein
VIYPANVKIPPNNIDLGCISFKIDQISLNDLIDSDKILSDLKDNLTSNRPYQPSEEELVRIILAPLGMIKGDRKEFCRELASLALHWLVTELKLVDASNLICYSLLEYLDPEEFISIAKQKEVNMNFDFIDALTDGKFSAAINDCAQKDAEIRIIKARAEAAETKAKAEAAEIRAEAAEIRAVAAETKAKAEVAELRAEVAEAELRAEAAELKAKIYSVMAAARYLQSFDPSTISKVTGLSVEEVERILNGKA